MTVCGRIGIARSEEQLILPTEAWATNQNNILGVVLVTFRGSGDKLEPCSALNVN